MHFWDLDLGVRGNYTRAQSESCICGVERSGWLEKCGDPKDEKGARREACTFGLLGPGQYG